VGTAGLEVVGSTYQRLMDFSSRTCIGSGKVKMIKVSRNVVVVVVNGGER